MHYKRILYINTFSWNNDHEMFNACLLEMCTNISNQVMCIAVQSNYESMCRVTEKTDFGNNVKYKKVRTIGGEGRFNLLYRYIWGALTSWWYIINSKKKDLIILPFNNLFALNGINIINKKLKRKIIICCHGEMESIASNINKKGLLSILLYKQCRSFFLNPQKNLSDSIYFTVLGDIINKNIKEYLPSKIKGHFMTIDHPYYFPQNTYNHKYNNEILKLGTCGGINNSKGLLEMIQFSKICKNKNINIKISHVGKILGELENLKKNGIITLNTNTELPRKKYNQLITELDYILFFYPQTSYKITASGAIMDAIALKKPIIALKNDYFEYIFNKFGKFGYLVDSIDEMYEVVQNLSKNNNNKTNFDFIHIQNKFRPTALQYQLENIIDHIFINTIPKYY